MTTTTFVPKYQRIIDDYRAMIADGILKPGDKLPSRDEIVADYGVTRATVNRAMGELLRDGLLTASQRSGTYVAEPDKGLNDCAAFVVHNDLLMAHLVDWSSAKNYYSMFGRLIELVPENKRRLVNLSDVQRTPDLLKSFRRILWNNLSREEFEHAVEVVGDRSRFLLLNRYYPDCDFVSINHRQAAFDLAERFLPHLDPAAPIGLLDMPFGENLSNRFVWLERRAGFMDACEKYNRFYRLIEMKQDSYTFNQEQLNEFDKRRAPGKAALLLSPSKEMMGALLGFMRDHDYRLGREYFYGDFDNDQSLKQYGLEIPTVVEDFGRIAELAAENLWKPGCRIFVDHTIINDPFQK